MKRHNIEFLLGWRTPCAAETSQPPRRPGPRHRLAGLREDLVCHGPEAVAGTFADQRDEGYDIDALELIVIGAPGHAVLGVHRPDLTDIEGIKLDGRIYNVFTITDGKVVRIEDHAHRHAALAGRRPARKRGGRRPPRLRRGLRPPRRRAGTGGARRAARRPARRPRGQGARGRGRHRRQPPAPPPRDAARRDRARPGHAPPAGRQARARPRARRARRRPRGVPPLPAASFDAVVFACTLCTVADLDRALAEARRVLKADGRLVVLEHVRGGGQLARWQDAVTPLWSRLMAGCHPNRDTPAAIQRPGFRLEHIERFDPLPRWVPARPMLQAVAVPTER